MDAISPKTVMKKVYSRKFCKVSGCANQSGRDKAMGLDRKYHRFPGKRKFSIPQESLAQVNQ